jgi:hypothetical protein
MPAIASRRSAGLAVAVVCAVVMVGCGGGQSATSTATSTPSTSTAEPTTTTIPPLTAEEVAWLDGLTELKEELQKQKDKIVAAATTGLTRPLMVLLGKTLGSCSRELARLGAPPGDRLQPVDALAKKACQQLGKAARCQATMARLSDASGGSPAVGSPQHRSWMRAGDCADAAEQKGVKLLEDAHAKGTEIQIIAAVGDG